jgi:translation elongation factor EF-Ts
VKDDSKSIGELVDEVGAKIKERVAIRRYARFELGDEAD